MLMTVIITGQCLRVLAVNAKAVRRRIQSLPPRQFIIVQPPRLRVV